LVTDRVGTAVWLDQDQRRHAVGALCIRDLKGGAGLRHCPSGKFNADAAWLVAATLAHSLLRWVAAIGLGARHELGGGQDAAPDPAGPARPADPLRQTMEVASAGRLAVGGVVRADTGPAALCGVRHLTHAAAERTPPDPFGSA
jgi:hypothetical protein